jgi:hypothetical protein
MVFEQQLVLMISTIIWLFYIRNKPTQHFFQHHQVLDFILNQLQLELRVIGDLYITANDLYLSVCFKENYSSIC